MDISHITLEELVELKKQIADRESSFKKVMEVTADLEKVSKKHGYETLDSALTDMGYVKKSTVEPKAKRAAKSGERKARVTITEELRQKVLDLLDIPKTAKQIAEELGISSGTVSSIKKKAGKTVTRNKSAETPA